MGLNRIRLGQMLGLWLPVAILLMGFTLPQLTLPQSRAEDRLFLDLSLELLGDYTLPKQTFAETPVGGLSALTYDRQRDRLYALSDDRSQLAPARFYTLKATLPRSSSLSSSSNPFHVDIEAVTFLKSPEQAVYNPGTIDPEGIALSPQRTLFISSEGSISAGIDPFIAEFDLETGQWQRDLRLPSKYLPNPDPDEPPQGIQDNLGFEALTIGGASFSTPNAIEPFRLFAATEFPLAQDQGASPSFSDSDVMDLESPNSGSLPVDEAGLSREAMATPYRNRLLHYLIGEPQPLLLAEHLYPLSPEPFGSVAHGLAELLALDQAGHFLSLERSFSLQGFKVKLFQVAIADATDLSRTFSLQDTPRANPIRKQLLLDLADFNIPLDNLEGMTLGPRLPDGSDSLILVSDDNFSEDQQTQFLVFRIRSN